MTISTPEKKLLCIDDDRSIIKVVDKVLSNAFGKNVLQFHEAATGEAGLEKIKDLKPDIILCDIHIPGLDGFEVCRQVRTSGVLAAVVLMSAYDDDEDPASQAKEAGADAFLAKPIKKGELLFVVNYILRIDSLNDAVFTKNQQLEKSLAQVNEFHQKLEHLNVELQGDKKSLNENLKEMIRLNSQLESKNSQITEMNAELAKQFDSTVGLLASIIEINQVERRGHAERVAGMSVYIAEKMELSGHLVQNIKTAARLHELGIVSLPKDEKMEDALDEGKSRKVTNHPLVGEMLLKGFPGFELIADIIRHMNENIDGSGMPDGLVGTRIPVGSRIVSVASYYDHSLLASPNLPPDHALKKVENAAGNLFDEDVVSLLGEYITSNNNEESMNTVDCNVFTLEEGMELASDIYSESGISLLRKGTVLNQEMISKILKFNNVDPVAGNIKIRQA